MVRRPLRQRPLGSLVKLAAKLPKLPKPAKLPKLPKPAAAPSFAEAMRRDGTVPLRPSFGRVLPPKQHQTPARVPPAPSFRIDVRDGFIDGQRTRLSARDLARLHGPPRATLDLHRRDAKSARTLLADFLEQQRASGADRVLVIVGKGRHSAGGVAVLRTEIGDWLGSPPLSAHVLAFATARPELGGTGCVQVLLAPAHRTEKPTEKPGGP